MKKRVLCVLSTSIIMAFRNYDGKKFSIVTTGNNAQNIYIRSARLNGNDYTKCYIEYRDIMKGGTLELTVSDKPNTNFGT
jgi:putative alpha-1,2-mannosidase